MNRRRDQDENFESRLLAHLKALVAERGDEAARQEARAGAASTAPLWRRRGPRLALVGALALAGIVVALVVTAGGGNGSTAFAVEPRPGGGVTIKVYKLEDAAGLEAALEEAGIPAQVNWLPAGMVCREPHYKPTTVHLPGGGTFVGGTSGGPNDGGTTIAIGSTEDSRRRFGEYRRGEMSEAEFDATMANMNLDPAAFGPGQTVVISGTPVPYDGDPEGGSITKFAVAEGPVEPCEPVPAPPDGTGGAFGLAPEGGPAYKSEGDPSLGRAAIVDDLHRAAAAAARSSAAPEVPGHGQFLYQATELTQLEAWLPKGDAKGSKEEPRYFVPINDPRGRYALVPATKEVWTSRDGKTREREALGKIDFLSAADQNLWESAGSPPPWAFDPAYHHVSRDGSGTLYKEFARESFRGRHEFTYMKKMAALPTEPEALRLSVENRHPGGAPLPASPETSVRGGATVDRLLEILAEPLAPPALRSAAYDALAEIPDIGLERGVIDSAGRKGDAIGWTRGEGFGQRFIFDPRTSKLLARAEMIYGAKAARYPQLPDGTVFRETAFLRTGIVDSIHAR